MEKTIANHVILDRIWSSDKLAACSINAQLHYPRIYLVSDDWACFEIDIPVIRGNVYPKMPKVTVTQIDGWLSEYHNNGLLFRWREGSTEYGYWTGPEEGRLHPPSRRHKRRTPEPDSDCTSRYLQNYKSLQSDYKALQGDYPIPIPGPSPIPKPIPSIAQKELCAEGFKIFWKAFPRKRSKAQAEKAWNKINPDEQLQNAIIESLERAKTQDFNSRPTDKVPYPATWLNAKGWQDEISDNGADPATNYLAEKKAAMRGDYD